MSLELRRRIFEQLDQLVLIDPHTHINPHAPASRTLADILGYHYYTELAHSAGMPREEIEEPGLDPREKVRRLVGYLPALRNTIQYSWLVEICQTFFGLDDADLTPDNWQSVYDQAQRQMAASNWEDEVLRRSRLEAVFLTNEFDDPLEGFDTRRYIPCLRTDDLVFHLAKEEVRRRLQRASGLEVGDARSLRRALAHLFEHFKRKGARACAISLPPDFTPRPVSAARANTALAALRSEGPSAAAAHRQAIGYYVFWTLAELCDLFRLPFDLMIGVNRNVYAAGVHQGRDLFDSRVSLLQYQELFNQFPRVLFPISVLASVTNQELTSYAWIFPNVITHGHWWYSNTPAFIEHDLAARLEAVPHTKQIGYYSDMYKLEFALPKFAMYKRILAKVLAERFVIDRGWSETRAIELGRQVLRTNVEGVFRWGEDLSHELPDLARLEPLSPQVPLGPIPAAVALAAEEAATPLAGESERLERLPEEPPREFVLPVSAEEASGEEGLGAAAPLAMTPASPTNAPQPASLDAGEPSSDTNERPDPSLRQTERWPSWPDAPRPSS
jgi:glucuronate isomerase